MELELGILFIRVANAVLWTVIAIRVLVGVDPLPLLARKLIATVIIFGMWTLVLGGIVPLGFPGEVARTVYSIFAAYAGLVALGIATSRE